MMKAKAGIPTRRSLRAFIRYLLLTVGSVVMLFPFLWMVSTSLKPRGTYCEADDRPLFLVCVVRLTHRTIVCHAVQLP